MAEVVAVVSGALQRSSFRFSRLQLPSMVFYTLEQGYRAAPARPQWTCGSVNSPAHRPPPHIKHAAPHVAGFKPPSRPSTAPRPTRDGASSLPRFQEAKKKKKDTYMGLHVSSAPINRLFTPSDGSMADSRPASATRPAFMPSPPATSESSWTATARPATARPSSAASFTLLMEEASLLRDTNARLMERNAHLERTVASSKVGDAAPHPKSAVPHRAPPQLPTSASESEDKELAVTASPSTPVSTEEMAANSCVTSETEAVESAVELAVAERDAMVAELDSLRKERDELRLEAAAARERDAQKQKQRETLLAEVGRLQRECERQRAQICDMQAEAERAKASMDNPPQGKLWADEALALERADEAERRALLLPSHMLALLVLGWVKGSAHGMAHGR